MTPPTGNGNLPVVVAPNNVQLLANALLTQSLEQELGALIFKHGKPAVKDAVNKLTKAKRGRPPDKDWPLLRAEMEQDARDWISGVNPVKRRKNYGIAQRFAEANKGQSFLAKHRRIMGKLAERRSWMGLVTAYELTRSGHEFAYTDHVRVLKELARRFSDESVWHQILDFANRAIEMFQQLNGAVPDGLSMTAVEDRNKKLFALGNIQMATKERSTGLLGTLRGAK